MFFKYQWLRKNGPYEFVLKGSFSLDHSHVLICFKVLLFSFNLKIFEPIFEYENKVKAVTYG